MVNVTQRGHDLWPGVVVRGTTPGGITNNYGEGSGGTQDPSAWYSGIVDKNINGIWYKETANAIAACSCQK